MVLEKQCSTAGGSRFLSIGLSITEKKMKTNAMNHHLHDEMGD